MRALPLAQKSATTYMGNVWLVLPKADLPAVSPVGASLTRRPSLELGGVKEEWKE